MLDNVDGHVGQLRWPVTVSDRWQETSKVILAGRSGWFKSCRPAAP